ncbi:hypothetical protein EBZ38_15065 [bacterium]|nr:hypothetical protein [bacterium]
MPATYEPIATTTLGSAASSITFNSIPGTYTDLRLVFTGKSAGGSNTLRLRFNSDSGTNYSRTSLTGSGSSATSAQNSSTDNAFIGAVNTLQMMCNVDIFSYAGSTNKTLLSELSLDQNGSGEVRRTVCLWRSTSVITAIELYLSAANFDAGATATLYGIKAA